MNYWVQARHFEAFQHSSKSNLINFQWNVEVQALSSLLPDLSLYSGNSLSDHLTKIPIGSSVSQIAISETSHKRPPGQD